MSPSPPSAAWSVSQLTAVVRGALTSEPELEDVLVEGELSNVRMPFSGHLYFTLKDAQASIRCVVWRSARERIPFHPENGMTVLAHGRVDVYEQDGAYQLYVDRLDPAGLGALALAVEQLSRRLAGEGLFDDRLKRPLPMLPGRVAVITSRTGAALRDVLTVLRRRAPGVGAVLVSAPVQGDGAEAGLILALERAEQLRGIDTILLVRGGGSLEDLWAFQSEALARAIRASTIPVVTGIGHETDITIADHAADRRAPTPSAAAELAVPDTRSLAVELQGRVLRLRRALGQELTGKRRELEARRARLARVSPAAQLPAHRQALDGRVVRLRAALLQSAAAQRRRLDQLTARLAAASPAARVPMQRDGLRRRRAALDRAATTLLAARRARLEAARGRLEALSPRRVIERGYSLTLDAASGAAITTAAGTSAGQLLRSVLREGELLSRVEAGPEPGAGSTP